MAIIYGEGGTLPGVNVVTSVDSVGADWPKDGYYPNGPVAEALTRFGQNFLLNGEADPTGRKASDPGAKLDAGKLRPELVLAAFAPALEAVVKIGTDGAAKYTDNGWVTVPNGVARYLEAEGRHRMRRWLGEVRDKDSKSLHLAHEAWNALAALTLYLKENPA